MFNFGKVNDFEKHINLSIPNYSGLCDIFRAFASEYLHPEGSIIDIGCSTGRFLHSIPKKNKATYVGSDVIDMVKYTDFDFVHKDCEEVLKKQTKSDVIVSMFTLQFLGKHKRERVVSELKRLVRGGAVLLVSEKCFFNSEIESVMKKEHVQQKRQWFKDSEILDKEQDLFGSMYCLSDKGLLEELSSIGEPVPVWQSYNFRGYLVR